MLNNKGAMFGLDARIALAIFGTLSIITGAALHSAIQDARVVSAVTSLKEIAKAYDSYLLDTGREVSLASGSHYNIVDLVEKPSGVAIWRGPYISYAKNASTTLRLIDTSGMGNNFLMRCAQESDWNPNIWMGDCSSAHKPCAVWIEVEGIWTKSPGLAEKIDEYIDGSVDFATGDVRGKIGSNLMMKITRSQIQP
ncbi:MAG TPA: hypothetical protein DCL21_00110 [Alphaproteobacteria bacterium]|nr:hypothetical protein [Alphaproteobacteria bacterium]